MTKRKGSPKKQVSSYAVPVYSIAQQWELVELFRALLVRSALYFPDPSPPLALEDIYSWQADVAFRLEGDPLRIEYDAFCDPDPSSGDFTPFGDVSRTLARLEHAWQRIDPAGGAARNEVYRTPFDGFISYVFRGLFPPPEFLLTIQQLSSSYFDATGSVSLEHAFFGPLKPGIGNYAARTAMEIGNNAMARAMRTYAPELSRVEAAQELKGWLNLDAEVDSLMRMAKATRARQKKEK